MKKNILLILFFIIQNPIAKSQQWDSVGCGPAAGFVDVLAADTVNHLIFAGGGFHPDFQCLSISGDNLFQWDGTSWALPGYATTIPFGSSIISSLKMINNNLYIGGSYGENISYWDGSNYIIMANGLVGQTSAPWDDVYSITTYNGDIYAGGSFLYIGPYANFDTVSCVARWDGMHWQKLTDSVTGIAGVADSPSWHYYDVRAMIEFNGELFVGGYFTRAGGKPASSITRWNGNTWDNKDTIWSCNCGTTTFCIYNNELYRAGMGTEIGKLNATGTGWQSIATFYHPSFPIIYAMTVYKNELVVGGVFDSIGGIAAKNIAAWNGSAWHTFGTGITGLGNYGVKAFTILDGCLYAGGAFNTAGGLPIEDIAVWCDPTGINVPTNNNFSISFSPNPFHEKTTVTIRGNNREGFNFEMIDALGRTVKTIEKIKTKSFVVERGNLNAGIYFYRLTDRKNNLLTSGKIIVE